jgi:hypothetical protein
MFEVSWKHGNRAWSGADARAVSRSEERKCALPIPFLSSPSGYWLFSTSLKANWFFSLLVFLAYRMFEVSWKHGNRAWSGADARAVSRSEERKCAHKSRFLYLYLPIPFLSSPSGYWLFSTSLKANWFFSLLVVGNMVIGRGRGQTHEPFLGRKSGSALIRADKREILYPFCPLRLVIGYSPRA